MTSLLAFSTFFPPMHPTQRLKLGSIIPAIGALGLSGASAAIFAQGQDITTTNGRLLCAGALANFSLSLIWALIALFPLRRGEKWAFWAFVIPIPLYGIPMLFLDATQSPREELVSTLAPQVGGLLIAAIGLSLAASVIFRKSVKGN